MKKLFVVTGTVLTAALAFAGYLHAEPLQSGPQIGQKVPGPFALLDCELVARLLHFAQNDGWGRERVRSPAERTTELAHYLEDILPAQLERSRLVVALPLGLVFVLDVHGHGGGRWTCRCHERAISVRPGAARDAHVTYRMEAAILDNLIHSRQTAQQAFLEGQIQIDGDMEKAVKMAMLFELFLAENTDRPLQRREELHGAAGR